MTPATNSDVISECDHIGPYTTWHPDIVRCKSDHQQMRFGGTNTRTTSIRFQMINYLAWHPDHGYNREQLSMIRDALCPDRTGSGDVIQSVNKVEQGGLALDKITGVPGSPYYGLSSIRFTDRYLHSRVLITSQDDMDAQEKRNREFFSSLSTDSYEVGHRDPRKPLTPDNTVMQPHIINRSHRDNYIFDDHGLPTVPTPEALAAHPDRFYSRDDQRIILEALTRNLES